MLEPINFENLQPQAATMIGQLFAIIGPVMIAVAVGFVLARLGHKDEPEFVGRLITNVGAPCLVFSTLSNLEISPATVGILSAAALAGILACTAVSYPILRVTGLSVRGYLPSLVHPNTGNMGLPLCLFAFGEEGLALAVAYYVVNSISQYVVTPSIASGDMSIRRLVRSPIVYAVGASLTILLTDITAPRWLDNAASLLAGMTIPLLLVTLGYSLARLRVENLKVSIALSVLRLAMGFAVGVAISELLGLEGAARGVAILQASMPVAILNYLFANQYAAEPEGVASLVVVSTIMSFVTLPPLLWYVL